MTHVYALGHLLGRPDCAALVDHGVAALRGRFRDGVNGGWWARVSEPTGRPCTDKTAYEHAFVVLAAASATAADRPGARELLDEALTVLLDHFWDDVVRDGRRAVGRGVDHARRLSRRQRQHAHGRGAAVGRRRARRLRRCASGRCGSSRAWCTTSRAAHEWRIPEHFDAVVDAAARVQRRRARPPVPPVRRHDRPLARVGPAGPAPACRRSAPIGSRRGCCRDALSLFDAAVREGWAVDGADGFVYTVDWSGRPVVRERMHWVAAEATAAAAALHQATGDASYADWYATWWQHIDDLLPRPRARLLAPRAVARPTSPAASPGRASPTPTTPSRPP